MKRPNQRPLRRWQGFVALAVGWLATVMLTQAQTATHGTVQGRVFNPVSKQYVRDAEVRLEGTNQVAYTESDGSFQFNGVALGPASISVVFSGYNLVKDSFTVSAGQPAVRAIH